MQIAGVWRSGGCRNLAVPGVQDLAELDGGCPNRGARRRVAATARTPGRRRLGGRRPCFVGHATGPV